VSAIIAADYTAEGITAIAIHPGAVITDMSNALAGKSIILFIFCIYVIVSGSKKDLIASFGISPQVSAEKQLEVFHKLTIADSGKFLSYTGEELPW